MSGKWDDGAADLDEIRGFGPVQLNRHDPSCDRPGTCTEVLHRLKGSSLWQG